MSGIQSIKGTDVYMILYNYSDFDYSIIKIMSNLEEAYGYICLQEKQYSDKFNMIQVQNIIDLKTNYIENSLNICYIISGKYNKFNLCDYCGISSYAIIPMTIN
jgi:hypothetical protein